MPAENSGEFLALMEEARKISAEARDLIEENRRLREENSRLRIENGVLRSMSRKPAGWPGLETKAH